MHQLLQRVAGDIAMRLDLLVPCEHVGAVPTAARKIEIGRAHAQLNQVVERGGAVAAAMHHADRAGTLDASLIGGDLESLEAANGSVVAASAGVVFAARVM